MEKWKPGRFAGVVIARLRGAESLKVVWMNDRALYAACATLEKRGVVQALERTGKGPERAVTVAFTESGARDYGTPPEYL